MRATRVLVPAAVFVLVLGAHFVWAGRDAECTTTDQCCETACAPSTSRMSGYVDEGSYWLGLSYASSAAFAAIVLRRAFERRSAAARAGAARGLALSALLPFAGCWLVGCCGSPMLAVYLNFLGASFLPFAKPLIAVLTGAMLAASWAWMRRTEARQATACAPAAGCGC